MDARGLHSRTRGASVWLTIHGTLYCPLLPQATWERDVAEMDVRLRAAQRAVGVKAIASDRGMSAQAMSELLGGPDGGLPVRHCSVMYPRLPSIASLVR